MGLGDCQVGGHLVQASLRKISGRVRQGKIQAIGASAGREGPQQRLDGLGLPVEREAERVIGQQPRRVRPVTRLRMAGGLGNLAILDEPSCRQPVQAGTSSGSLVGSSSRSRSANRWW
jgi:hypothetical protein